MFDRELSLNWGLTPIKLLSSKHRQDARIAIQLLVRDFAAGEEAY